MSKRLWTGLLVGLLGAMALLAVGVGAFHAGERHSEPVATVIPGTTGAGGEVVRVVDYGHWRGGPPFGFLFPLLIIGIIAVLVAGRRRAYWGGGPGSCGPGWGGGRDTMLADWHRRVHGDDGGLPPAAA
jgi:hypothetical protein